MNYYPWLENQQIGPNTSEGEFSATDQLEERKARSMIARAEGAKQMDIGAQVGAGRNLEFTAGQRSHRLSTGSYTKA